MFHNFNSFFRQAQKYPQTKTDILHLLDMTICHAQFKSTEPKHQIKCQRPMTFGAYCIIFLEIPQTALVFKCIYFDPKPIVTGMTNN